MLHMKNSLLFFTVAISLLPALTAAVAAIPWNISNMPVSGLRDIAFPFSIANAPPKRGYYFAQQYTFKGSGLGYIGLQPRPNATSGDETFFHIRGVFSTFINGSTTVDPNCHLGADSHPGVSCGVEFLAPYADSYVLEIRNTEGTTWNGTVVDTVTTSRYHIGSYTLPAGTEGIGWIQLGFVEYFLPCDCPDLPYASVEFGTPVTSNAGSVGWLEDPSEHGDCVGKIDFKWKRTPRGIEMSFGFKAVEFLSTWQRIAKSFFLSI